MSLLKVAGTTASSEQLYVNDVFSVYLYTGNGSTQTITNGIDLTGKGGLVWLKSRSTAYYHNLFDTNRGIDNRLWTPVTTAQTYTAGTLTAFNSNGFSLGATNAGINETNNPMVSWTFRKAAKFFDVVTYTGTGSARTIAHSLGVAPGMVIVKRTDTTSDWQVYSNGMTSAAYSMQLNLTAAQASAPTVWNSTAPTSSVFSVGTDATVNASGGTYVAYLYAHDTSSTGIIQCGSFTTNGSGNATVNLGWEPQYLLTKKTNNTGNWVATDVMRAMSLTETENLYPNTSGAAVLNGVGVAIPNATGFSEVGIGPSSTYIYMAIRMPNKPPTSGTQVFSPIVSAAAAGTTLTTNFAIDMQMMAYRAGLTENSSIVDRLRGVSSTTTEISKSLRTSSTVAETVSPLLSQLWNNTGFNLPTGISGGSDIFWSFKRAPGFFDVVCGTGFGNNKAHNLTVIPEFIIFKQRNAVSPSYAYIPNTPINLSFGTLNTTDAFSGNNNVAATSTTFDTCVQGGVGTETYVTYLFATLAGISKVGSYTGNGTTQTINCGFTGGARFVLIKRTDSTGDWFVWDTARGIVAANDPHLSLNTTAAEVTTDDSVDPYSAGFAVNQVAATNINVSSATYIFLAIA